MSLGSTSAQKQQNLQSVGQDANYAISNKLPGMSAVTVYAGAPAGFDPTIASDEEMLAYGDRRRPAPNDKKAYRMWQRAVATTRIAAELVPNPGRFHRANQQLATVSTVKNTTKVLSSNWSATVVGRTPVFDEVVGIWVVPNIGSPVRVVHRLQLDVGGNRWQLQGQ